MYKLVLPIALSLALGAAIGTTMHPRSNYRYLSEISRLEDSVMSLERQVVKYKAQSETYERFLDTCIGTLTLEQKQKVFESVQSK